jgi:hypothetical protein
MAVLVPPSPVTVLTLLSSTYGISTGPGPFSLAGSAAGLAPTWHNPNLPYWPGPPAGHGGITRADFILQELFRSRGSSELQVEELNTSRVGCQSRFPDWSRVDSGPGPNKTEFASARPVAIPSLRVESSSDSESLCKAVVLQY